jgi:tight adherence protein C
MTIVLLVATFFAVGVLMIFLGLAQRAALADALQRRARRVATPVSARTRAPETPGWLRVLGPAGVSLGTSLRARTERGRLQSMQRRLVSADRPFGLTVPSLLVIKAVVGAVFTIFGVYFFLRIAGIDFLFLPHIPSAVVLAVALGFVGYYLPDLWLIQLVEARRREIRRQLPEVCDLLSVCADAGASFDLALVRVIESPYLEGPLIDELEDAVRQFQYAPGRFEALMAMADRLEVEELTAFVAAIGQSFRQGTRIADVLRIQSDDIRRRARERAEEQANTASLKMLFPLVFLIFPTLLLVILTPAVIQAIQSITGGS